MHARTVRRRGGIALAMIVGLLVGATVLSGTAYPAGQGAAPVNIADPEDGTLRAQLTPDGALEVTGQVDLTGTSAVEVANFPAVQEMSGTVTAAVPVASQYRSLHMRALPGGSLDSVSFATINATFISLSSEDEVELAFFTPGLDAAAIRIGHNRQLTQTISLPIVVPLNRIGLSCHNEVNGCNVTISIIG